MKLHPVRTGEAPVVSDLCASLAKWFMFAPAGVEFVVRVKIPAEEAAE
ncbi:MAG: hypothetical protein O3C21_15350 [Verrucomicrobia bacterium]|nr:hypothetical protein [Verrucomicrobiota bacterium]